MENTKKYKSFEKEGYVLKMDEHMVKIKCDDYVLLHKVISSITSTKAIIQAIANGGYDDFISKVPDSYIDRVLDKSSKVFEYVQLANKEIDLCYNNILEKTDNKKDFMIMVNNNENNFLNPLIRNKYLKNEYNVLQIGSRCVKMYEIEERLEKLKGGTR